MFKTILFLTLCLIPLWLVKGCASTANTQIPSLVVATINPAPAASPTRPGAVPIIVALVMKTLTTPFFVEMEKGARQAEVELGIKLLVKAGAQEISVEQQFVAQVFRTLPGSSTTWRWILS